MSSSVTTFSGRRCTKVRRNATAPAGSGMAMTISSVSTTSTSTSTSSSTSSRAAASMGGTADSGNDNSAAPAVAQSTKSTTSSSTSTTQQTTQATPTTQTTPTSSLLQSSTTLAPVVATNTPPVQASVPPSPPVSPPTPPPEPAASDPASSSPEPLSSDNPAQDTPAPVVQPSAQPSAQNTVPEVSAIPAVTTSAARGQPHHPQKSMTADPLAIPISSPAVSSVVSPLAVSAASRTSTFASSVIPVPSQSATGPDDPGHDPADGANSSNGPASNKAAMAGGAVAGVVGGLLLFGLIFFFCFRKYRRGELKFRRRSVDTPLLSREIRPRSSNEFLEKIGRAAAVLDLRKYIKRRMPSVYEGPSPNPVFSSMTTRTTSPQGSSPRRRSWSEPNPTFRQRLQAAAGVLPIARKPVAKGFVVERRSPSIEDSPPQLPPVFQRQNGSVSSIARAVYSPEPDDELNPFRDPDLNAPLRIINSDPSRHGTPSVTPMQNDRVIFNPAYQSISMPTQPRPLYQRAQSQAQDPFLDPPNTIGTAIPMPSTPPTTSSGKSSHRPATSVSSLHSNRSSIGALPHIPSLQPVQQSPSHMPQLSNVSSNYSTGDSGFVSATDVLPISPVKEVHASALLPPLEPPSATRTPQGMAYQPSPGMTPLPSAFRGSKFGFDPNSFGEPGPTRPNTYFNDMITPGANSRMSDPFDLDKPELLGFTNDPSGTRKSYGRYSKRKTGSVSNWAMGPTIRPVQE